MIAHPRPLIDVLAAMPDFRQSRGTRHAFSAIVALACCAMFCGSRSESAIAAWGRNDGARMAQALGFTHATPCAATLHTIFRPVNRDECEAYGGAWAESVVESLPTTAEALATAVALEGKTRRGSKKQGAPGMHLLSARAHHVGVTLAQDAVDDKTNELTAVETLLHPWVLEGRVMTMDALRTQRHVAQMMVDKGGDDVMMVKEHQPQLHADIALVCAQPPWGDVQETASTMDLGHGRLAQRTLTARTALAGRHPWPGLAQVFQLERQVTKKKTGEERDEMVYGVSSLVAQRATPSQLFALVRGPWQMEHRSHWVRDVTFDADRSHVRCGSIPHVMTALRHTAIGLLRTAGYANLAAACRRFAAQPDLALALIGIALEN